MDRTEFRAHFKSRGPVVLPVIHALTNAQVIENIEVTLHAGAPGCFVINHNFTHDDLLPILKNVRSQFPDIWMGTNLLGIRAADAFPILADLHHQGCRIDGLWCDDAGIREGRGAQSAAYEIDHARRKSAWRGLYFGGTAFKYRQAVGPDAYRQVAGDAKRFMDVITTSGAATGSAADPSKIVAFRKGAGEHPLAIASGITPANAAAFSAADCFIVATGVSDQGSFFSLSSARIRLLLSVAEQMTLPAA